MYGDFSRLTFNPSRHYSAVVWQQGRVQIDADPNEHTAISLYQLRTFASDIVGPAAGPLGPDGNGGFRIRFADGKLTIGGGRYYVDGIMCQNETARELSYFDQEDAYLDPQQDALGDLPMVVYLRVWERMITAVEEPDIREVALGLFGPDTAARLKVVWQVVVGHTLPGGKPLNRDTINAEWIEFMRREHARTVAMQARGAEPQSDADLCAIAPDARYRGAENQLYRVEIHGAGKAGEGATFVWSRENGSVVLPIDSVTGTEVTLKTLGRDGKLALAVGDLVEIVDDAYACRVADPAAPLRRIMAVDALEKKVVLADPPADGIGTRGLHPFLRRWDHQAPISGPSALAEDGALVLTEGAWLDLEDNIQVRFDLGGEYRRGDHWLVPARTVTGDVEWPLEAGTPVSQSPAGVLYHYAPLAFIDRDGVVDLRCLFDTLPCVGGRKIGVALYADPLLPLPTDTPYGLSAVVANDRLSVFARAIAGTLSLKAYDQQHGWLNWIPLGEGQLSSAPSAVMGSSGRLVVFGRTMHGTLTHKYCDLQTQKAWAEQIWSGWVELGGLISSAPSAVLAGDRLTVFARAPEGTLTHTFTIRSKAGGETGSRWARGRSPPPLRGHRRRQVGGICA